MKNKKMIFNLCFVFILVSIVNVFYCIQYLEKFGMIIWTMAALMILFIAKKTGVGLEEGQTIRGKYKEQFLDRIFLGSFVVNTCFFVGVLILNSQTQSEMISRFIDMMISFVLAACFEEILIRGLYFDELRKKYSVIVCSIMCGIIFALFHIPQHILIFHSSFVEMLTVLCLGTLKGALLCGVNILTENIAMTAICHLNSGLYGDIVGLLVSLPIVCVKIAQQTKKYENHN